MLKLQQCVGNLSILRSFETGLLNQVDERGTLPPIFIVGSPRTGSTLLFQLMIAKYHFSYINNIQSFFYGTPALAARLTHKMTKKHPESFCLKSRYGYIRGIFSPAEAGLMFRNWFTDDMNHGLLNTDERHKKKVRKTLNYFTSFFSSPFLGKNLYNSLRLKRISTIFPEAFYIWVKREPLYTCQSLLKMREQLYGSRQKWASVKPFNYDSLKAYDPFEQVAEQVKSIDEYIEENIDNEQYIIINYEDLCTSPDMELGRISEKYCKLYGIHLRTRTLLNIELNLRNKQELDDIEWQQLRSAVNRSYEDRRL